MIMDIFYAIGSDHSSNILDLSNPIQFARNHITYIVVCNSKKDVYTWEQVRNCDNAGEHYTPDCLNKFKYFLFKDAYAYTEDYFEKRFVKKFVFE